MNVNMKTYNIWDHANRCEGEYCVDCIRVKCCDKCGDNLCSECCNTNTIEDCKCAEKCFAPIAHQIPSVNVGMMIGVMIVFHRIMNANMMDVKGIL